MTTINKRSKLSLQEIDKLATIKGIVNLIIKNIENNDLFIKH
jgi:hypothetical protein